MGFLKEFKEFAVKGNVVDLAIGVIIGGAFGAIVSSLVGDVITPLLLTPAFKATGEEKRRTCSRGASRTYSRGTFSRNQRLAKKII